MSQQVHLAVYDLSRGMAAAMSQQILGMRIDGIWHSGVVVFGQEYYFGGGVQVSPMGMFAAQSGMQTSQMLDMGRTNKTQGELQVYLRSINNQYTQATYDLINNNCNNFADVVCNFLCGHGIPTHIVDLPRIVFSTPGGAMLRPMIEGMQNNIRQQSGGGMDPFGSSSMPTPSITSASASASASASVSMSTNTSTESFESSLSSSIRTAVTDAVQQEDYRTAIRNAVKADLEEAPLVSGDSSAVSLLANKLLNLADSSGTKGSALSQDEKDILTSAITTLSSLNSSSSSSLIFPNEVYTVLEKLINNYAAAEMTSLFILRLIVLYDTSKDFKTVPLIQNIISRLSSTTPYPTPSPSPTPTPTPTPSPTPAPVPASVSDLKFSTISGEVMALSTLCNLFAHKSGRDYLLAEHSAEVVDIAMMFLSHTRTELRQMSATLTYNLVLACTPHSIPFLIWVKNVSDDNDELPPLAVQILCGVLEDLGNQTEITPSVLHRKLAVVCRIVRAFSKTAITFIEDLGFSEVFLEIEKGMKDRNSSEFVVLNEILYMFSNSTN